ncbi:MAG: Ada metal-binding domain-containing protein [bacterium]|nr:Ada metal-binding domain-containing protein [bacterium]
MSTIAEWRLKIKNFSEDVIAEWGLVAILFLVALASFGLGRLSAFEDVRPPVSITRAPEDQKVRAMTFGGQFVASKTGSAYYYPWCAGATKILPQNQRWFQSEDAARKAGYTPAKNCKGLSAQ